MSLRKFPWFFGWSLLYNFTVKRKEILRLACRRDISREGVRYQTLESPRNVPGTPFRNHDAWPIDELIRNFGGLAFNRPIHSSLTSSIWRNPRLLFLSVRVLPPCPQEVYRRHFVNAVISNRGVNLRAGLDEPYYAPIINPSLTGMEFDCWHAGERLFCTLLSAVW